MSFRINRYLMKDNGNISIICQALLSYLFLCDKVSFRIFFSNTGFSQWPFYFIFIAVGHVGIRMSASSKKDIFHISQCAFLLVCFNPMNSRSEVGALSVIAFTLRYDFALSHNALTLMRSVITSIIYRTGHIGAVIAFYSYCYKLTNQRYRFYSLALFCYYLPAFHFINSHE